MTETRERIIEATSALFMQRGYAGSGLKQISEASTSPIGSLYHHFPGGKGELAAETLRASGRAYQAIVEAVLDSTTDIVDAMRVAFDAAAETLRASDYADACPIATVALEVASSDEPLRQVTEEIFAGWLDALADRFAAAGIDESGRASSRSCSSPPSKAASCSAASPRTPAGWRSSARPSPPSSPPRSTRRDSGRPSSVRANPHLVRVRTTETGLRYRVGAEARSPPAARTPSSPTSSPSISATPPPAAARPARRTAAAMSS